MSKPSAQAAASRGYIDSDAKVSIKTPESLSLHGFKQLDSKWAVMGDITWTRHSRFDSLSINYSQPKSAPFSASNFAGQTTDKTTLVPQWKNSMKVAIGGTYQYSDRCSCVLAWPTTNPRCRTKNTVCPPCRTTTASGCRLAASMT